MAKLKVIQKAAKPTPKAPKEEVVKEPKTVQEGELNRRIKPSYRWIAADVVREAGDGAESADLITSCHAAAKEADLDPKEDAYWSRRLTRARALLRKAGLGVFKAKRMAPADTEAVDKPTRKAKNQVKRKKLPDDGQVEDA